MRAIVTYHSIDASGSPISCHPDAFARHMAWFASRRIQVTSVPDLVAMPASIEAVAITFDDAFANFEEIAAPQLAERGLPATLFVVADHVGRTNAWGGIAEKGIPHLPLLDWDSLVRLQERDVTIGAHTRRHSDLTTLPKAAVEDEVHGSADVIEQRLGARPSVFAYPYGRRDRQSTEVVARAFQYACTTEFQTLGADSACAALPRLDMYYFQEPGRLESWGTPSFNRFVAIRRGLRRFRQAAKTVTTAMLP